MSPLSPVTVLLHPGQGSGQRHYSLHTSLLPQSVDARGQCCLITSLHSQLQFRAISGTKAAENLLLFLNLNLIKNEERYVGGLGCFRVVFNVVWGLVLLCNKKPRERILLTCGKILNGFSNEQ